MDTREKKTETKRNWRERDQHFSSGQHISRVVSRQKRVSVDPSLIVQEEREDSFCQICHRVSGKRKDGAEDRMARTERESGRRRREVAGLLVLPRPAKSLQNGAGFSGKT